MTKATYQLLSTELLDVVEAHLKRRRIALLDETADLFVGAITPKIRDLVALVQELEG